MTNIEVIRDCRDMGFSFESISSMLAEPTPTTLRTALREAMADARKKLDESILEYERNISRYITMMEATGFLTDAPGEVEIEHCHAHNIVCYDFEGSFFDETMTFYGRFSELDRIVKEKGITRISPKRLLFSKVFLEDGQINPDKQSIRMYYEVKESRSSSAHFTRMPEMSVLSLIHIGAFEDGLVDSYHKVQRYAKKHGIRLQPVSIEEHMIDPSVFYNNSDMWVTKIRIPIA